MSDSAAPAFSRRDLLSGRAAVALSAQGLSAILDGGFFDSFESAQTWLVEAKPHLLETAAGLGLETDGKDALALAKEIMELCDAEKRSPAPDERKS